MKISIAMATYNGEKHLHDQLASIAGQTLLPDELIVCDDGSLDRTTEILYKFADRAPFETIVHQNECNLGYVANFDQAVKMCTGDIIFYADQDDHWYSEKLYKVRRKFASSPDTMVVINDARLCDGELNTVGHTQLGNLRRVGFSDSYFVMGCASAHRRCWSEAMLPVPDGRTHDFWVNHTAHLIGAVQILDEVLQDYRRHGSNTSVSSLSNVGGARIVDLMPGHGLASANASYETMIETLGMMSDRLTLGLDTGLLDYDLVDRGKTKIAERRVAFERRLQLCSAPRWLRLPLVLKMIAHGQYKHHLGLRSAIKDLVRP